MRKGLTTFLVILLALGAVLVSCKAEIEAPADELVAVSFEESASRALSATLEEFDVADYFWYYAAKKTDSTGLISGETTSYDAAGAVAISSGAEAKGLSGYTVPGFSQGTWKFTLYAYATRPTTATEKAAWVYSGEATGVVLQKGGTNKVTVTVSPNPEGKGILFVDMAHIYLSEASKDSDNQVSPVVSVVKHPSGTPVTDPPTGNLEYELPTGTYKVTVSYTDGYITYATGYVIATVYPGLTTTVTGYVDELVTYAEFDAKQNPDIVRETWGSNDITTSTATTVDLRANKSGDSKTEKVSSATMSADTAVKKLKELADNVGADSYSSSSLKLNLSVDTTDVKETSVTYDIGMEAILTYTKNTTQSTAKSDVKNVDDYVLVDINLTSDITAVSVTHSGETMILTDNMDKAGKAGETDPKYVDVNKGTEADPLWVGFYKLETTSSGQVLHIKTKSFSPFEVTYTMSDYVAVLDGVKYSSLDAAIAAVPTDGTLKTITLLRSISDVSGITIQNRNVILDLAGKTITMKATKYIDVDASTVTITGNGTINVAAEYRGSGIRVHNDSTLNFISGKLVVTETRGAYGILLFNRETVNLGSKDTAGPTIECVGPCLATNGSCEGGTFNVYSGTFTSTRGDGDGDSNVIQIANEASVGLNTVNIYGGTFTQTRTPADGLSNIFELRYDGKKIIHIEGGVFNCKGALFNDWASKPERAVTNYVFTVTGGVFNGPIVNNDEGDLVLKGGLYSVKPADKYLADGYIAIKTSNNKWEVVEFLPGAGTEAAPYIIADIDAWMLLVRSCEYDSTYSVTEGKYFRMTNDIDVSSKTVRATVHYFAGHIDFTNHVLSGFNSSNMVASDISDDGLVAVFSKVKGNVSFKNVTFNIAAVTYNNTTTLTMLAGRLYADTSVLFENITTDGIATGVTGNNNGPLCTYGAYVSGVNITCKNCTNNATIVGSGYRSAFIGSACFFYGATLSFESCVNNGFILTTGPAAMLIGNGNNTYASAGTIAITVKNCINNGRIIGSGAGDGALLINHLDGGNVFTVNEKTWAEYNADTRISGNLSGNPGETITTSVIDVTDGCFVLTKTDDAAYYQLQFAFSASSHAGGNVGYLIEFGNSTTPFDTTKDLPSNIKVSSWVDDETKVGEVTSYQPTNSTAGTLYLDASDHYVFNEQGSRLRDKVFVTFIAYGSNNEILSIKTYQY